VWGWTLVMERKWRGWRSEHDDRKCCDNRKRLRRREACQWRPRKSRCPKKDPTSLPTSQVASILIPLFCFINVITLTNSSKSGLWDEILKWFQSLEEESEILLDILLAKAYLNERWESIGGKIPLPSTMTSQTHTPRISPINRYNVSPKEANGGSHAHRWLCFGTRCRRFGNCLTCVRYHVRFLGLCQWTTSQPRQRMYLAKPVPGHSTELWWGTSQKINSYNPEHSLIN
jgi:hypothetical protein